ncbi:MAG: hypothetical protein JW832_02355 [Deltaproteobacteria bacterium]|nr:hypothetical protein [Deltaproteobacteria bacterium]
MRTKLFAFLAMVQAVAFAHCAGAEEISSTSGPLKGLQGVAVVVGIVSKGESGKTNLTQDTITRIVEMKLRTAGIKVVSREASLLAAGKPVMAVDISIRARDAFLYGNIAITVYEKACLERDKSTCDHFVTWQKSGTFSTKKNDPAQLIQDGVIRYMDDFLNDYLKANPMTEQVQPVPQKAQ